MKYLLAFLVVVLVAWRWRTARTARHVNTRHTPQSTAKGPTEMVRCDQCGTHLPANEAITGSDGQYCSQAHRHLAEP